MTDHAATALDLMHRLIEQSLRAWSIVGRTRIVDGHILEIDSLGRTIKIEVAPSDLPFRWMVTIGDRSRPALSTIAVLRQVRAALDSTFRPARARAVRPPSPQPPT